MATARARGLAARVAVLAAAIASAAVSVTVATDRVGSSGGGQPLLRVGFGPEQIWRPSREAIGALQACRGGNYTCVRAAMLADGASEDAVLFFRLTGWFLSGLQGGAPVQLGRIFVPWRANENEQWALLGGVPAVVLPEREANFDFGVQGNAEYRALQAEHPRLMFWGSGPALEGTDASPDGGQRFIFREISFSRFIFRENASLIKPAG